MNDVADENIPTYRDIALIAERILNELDSADGRFTELTHEARVRLKNNTLGIWIMAVDKLSNGQVLGHGKERF